MDPSAETGATRDARGLPRTGGVVVKLTPAEAAVAAAAAQGLSNREIARSLNKATGTVKSQLGTVYRKLAIRNRAHLILMLRS